MSGREIQHVPLDAEDRDFLQRVYKQRRKFLISLSFGFVVVAVYASFKLMRQIGNIIYDKPVRLGGLTLSRWDASWLTYFLCMCAIATAIIVSIYFKSVRKLRKDIAGGVKQQVPYTIVRKQEFPLANKYYVWLDSAENANHEVSEEVYYGSTEGDIIYIYRTPHARMVFERNGRFEII